MFSEHFCVSIKKMFLYHYLALPGLFVIVILLTSQHLWLTLLGGCVQRGLVDKPVSGGDITMTGGDTC